MISYARRLTNTEIEQRIKKLSQMLIDGIDKDEIRKEAIRILNDLGESIK